MRSVMLAAVVAAAFLTACERESAEPRAESKAPTTASGGASSSGASSTGPAGDKMALPEAPKGPAPAETKPDPGDANDHSSPQHDSKSGKKAGD